MATGNRRQNNTLPRVLAEEPNSLSSGIRQKEPRKPGKGFRGSVLTSVSGQASGNDYSPMAILYLPTIPLPELITKSSSASSVG